MSDADTVGGTLIRLRPQPQEVSPPRIKLYDFRRPDKFSKEQIRTISIMHESFARAATARLTELLRVETGVHVTMVDQMTYQEFLDDLERPTTLMPISMVPLKGASLLQMDRSLTSLMIDRVYGGPGQPTPPCSYTDLEETALLRLLQSLVSELSHAWKPVTNAAFEEREIEKNKTMVMITPPTEMIVLVTWDVTVCGTTASLRLAIPYLVLEPLLSKLTPRWWYSSVRRGPADHPPAGIAALPIDTEILVPAASLTVSEVVNLETGHRVAIPNPEEAVVRVGGQDLLSARPSDLPGRYDVLDDEPIRGAAVLDRLLGRDPETAEQGNAVAQSVEHALSEHLTPLLAEVRAELARVSAQQATLADSTMLREVSDYGFEGGAQPFDFLRATDAASVAVLLNSHHPQIAAMVLAHLEPRVAASVLLSMPPDVRTSVVRRIAAIDPVSPTVIKTTEEHIADRLRGMDAWISHPVGGIDGAGAVLNYTSAAVEAEVIRGLEESDPELSEKIKRGMFVFEDIAGLDSRDLRIVLGEADPEDLAVALKVVQAEIRNHMLDHLPSEQRQAMEARLAELSRPRLADVDAAQQRVVEVTRRLDLAGEITVARPGEAEGGDHAR